MRRLASPFPLLPGALALCLLVGCGSSGPVRQEVTGKVLFNNQPLDEGIIDFEPLDGQGSKSGSTILNGEYQIPRDKGLFPGRYRVRIIAGDGTSGGGKAEPSGPRPGATPGKERIPPEYNLKSEITKEVKQDETNRFDFSIP
jgi:hypothetical protein